MKDDQFIKLIKYLDQRFAEVDEKFARVDERFNMLTTIIDGYADKIDTYAMEMAAMQHKIDRLERYIQVIAKKTNIDLDAIHAL